MSAVIVILSVGVGLIAGGFFYHLLDDIITDFFLAYVYNTGDPYYLGSALLWDAWPFAMIIMGLVCFILAGVKHRNGGN